jgi:hypothetical protein
MQIPYVSISSDNHGTDTKRHSSGLCTYICHRNMCKPQFEIAFRVCLLRIAVYVLMVWVNTKNIWPLDAQTKTPSGFIQR